MGKSIFTMSAAQRLKAQERQSRRFDRAVNKKSAPVQPAVAAATAKPRRKSVRPFPPPNAAAARPVA